MVAVVRVRPVAAATLGTIWGLVAGYGVASWFPGMVVTYFECATWKGWVGAFAMIAALFAVYFAAFSAWLSWSARRRPVGVLSIGAAWVAFELARTHLWVGDPWAAVAYSQTGWSSLLQVADLTGPYGIGFLIAAVNAVVASFFTPSIGATSRAREIGMVGLLVVAAVAYGAVRLRQPFDDGETLRVAVVQTAVERGLRWRPEYVERGVEEHLGMTVRALPRRPDLVVWPEYAISFYPDEATPQRARLLAGTRAAGVDVILGAPHYEFTADRRTLYHNSVYLVRDGFFAGRYDKMHLLPFAEDSLGIVDEKDRTSYTPGREPVVFATGPARVGAFVCFEAMYPTIVRRFVNAGATLLVNVSNDSWFGSDAAARHHLDVSTMRAIETRRWLVRGAATGISAVIDPHGRVVVSSVTGKPDLLVGDVATNTARTPYTRVGDVFAFGCLLVAAIASIVRTPSGSNE